MWCVPDPCVLGHCFCKRSEMENTRWSILCLRVVSRDGGGWAGEDICHSQPARNIGLGAVPLSPYSLVPLSLCLLCSVGQERFQSPKTPQERDCETWANGLADLSAWRFLAWECKINEFIIFILKNYPSPLSSNSYPERSKIANFNTFLMCRMLAVDPSNHSYNFQWTGKIC